MTPTPAPEFIACDLARDRAALIELNIEYMTWVLARAEEAFGVAPEAALGMPVQDYVPAAIDRIAGGVGGRASFYLAQVDGRLAGMGGLRVLAPGTVEIKRIYCRPAFRGQGLGAQLVTHLLDEARHWGAARVVLDSAPFMTSAHRLYAAFGFTDCAAYEGVEAPAEYHDRWRFMALDLAPAR